MKWFEKAALQGDVIAQFNLAVSYAQGKGVPQDLRQAYVWFGVAARESRASLGASGNLSGSLDPAQLALQEKKALKAGAEVARSLNEAERFQAQNEATVLFESIQKREKIAAQR